MRILGIDPGLASTGWGVIDHDGSRSVAVASGTVVTAAGQPTARRLKTIHDGIAAVVARHRPAHAAVERLFFCTNVSTAMAVAEARGVAILATANAELEVFEYTPLQVKQAVTGSGKAAKAQVDHMVRALLGLGRLADAPKAPAKGEGDGDGGTGADDPFPRTDHASDALAIALCHAHGHGFRTKAAAAAAQATAATAKTAARPGGGQAMTEEIRAAWAARRRRR